MAAASLHYDFVSLWRLERFLPSWGILAHSADLGSLVAGTKLGCTFLYPDILCPPPNFAVGPTLWGSGSQGAPALAASTPCSPQAPY